MVQYEVCWPVGSAQTGRAPQQLTISPFKYLNEIPEHKTTSLSLNNLKNAFFGILPSLSLQNHLLSPSWIFARSIDCLEHQQTWLWGNV